MSYRLHLEHMQERLDIVEILKLFAETQRQALHRQKISGTRHVEAQIAHLFEYIEASVLAEKALGGIVEPAFRQAFPLGSLLRRTPKVSRGNKKRLYIFCCLAGVKSETHDRATGTIDLTANSLLREMIIQPRE